MNFYSLVLKNLLNIPLLCFLIGIIIAIYKPSIKLPLFIKKFLTISVLFSIGLKGGGPLVEHSASGSNLFLSIIGSLSIWAMIQPLLSFYLLKMFTKVDKTTAAAIAACFGSISIITFITAISFLDQMNVSYRGYIIAALAIMDIPAIISGIYLGKAAIKHPSNKKISFGKLIKEALLNKAIVSILFGLLVGGLLVIMNTPKASDMILTAFKPILSFFLFDLGLTVGLQRRDLKSFSWSLSLFGLYMPLIGGFFGLLFSFLFNLDVGTGTLMAVLCASASYISVPAAMRIALPAAKEALYLPLSLTLAFPFNVIIGIPIYYYFASVLLKKL